MNTDTRNADDMKRCIETCWECRDTCQTMLYNTCLNMGGEHVAAAHVKLMTDCIEICQLAADMMTRQSSQHVHVCAACAEICAACAESCARLPGHDMAACATICLRCAESCRAMSCMIEAA